VTLTFDPLSLNVLLQPTGCDMAKSSNLRLSHSDLKIEHIGSRPHLGFQGRRFSHCADR